MKKIILTVLLCLLTIHLYSQTNLAVCLDGRDNNLRIGMDSICGHWTLEAWIKPDTDKWKHEEVIIGGGEYSSLNSLDNLPLTIKEGKLHNAGANLTGCEIPQGEWSHVAAVCDGTHILLYLNGIEVARADTATIVLPGSIGINESSESIFGGCIDEVRIWETELSSKDLCQWMYRPVTPKHKKFKYLKGYYNFDDFSDDISLNRAAEGRLSFHLRNGRLEQYKNAPLAHAIISDNPLFQTNYGKQELFKVVALPTEWDADKGQKDFQLIKLRIETQGEISAQTIKQLLLDFKGSSSLKDIERIHIYNTGSKPRSTKRTELIEGGIPLNTENIKINLPENDFTKLKHGTNYLLITADISSHATTGNNICISIPSVKIGRKSIAPIRINDCLPIQISENSFCDKQILKVLQWNIWHGGNHLGKDGRERIIDLIKATNADVVTMQEGYGSQEMIARGIGFHLQTPSPKDNLCLYSRYPVQAIKTNSKFFSNPCILSLPQGKKVYINGCWLRYAYRPAYSSHCANYGMISHKWASEDSILGLTDIQRLLKNDLYPYVDQTMPVIIGGDFNSGSHLDWTGKAASLHFGYKAENLPISRYMYCEGFKDSFRELHRDELERGEGTFAVIYGQSQTSRIDYIYYRGKGIIPISSKIMRTMPDIDDIWPGDHAAVLTVFKIVE